MEPLAWDFLAFLEAEGESRIRGLPRTGDLTRVHNCLSEIEKGDYKSERSKVMTKSCVMIPLFGRQRAMSVNSALEFSLHSEVNAHSWREAVSAGRLEPEC